jgi:hypothetical protein
MNTGGVHGSSVRRSSQMELADKVLIEHAHLAVENERRSFQCSDRVGQLAEAISVVDALAADKSDVRAVLEGQHAPPVVFLLVDPAESVERLGKERLHRHYCPRERDHGDHCACSVKHRSGDGPQLSRRVKISGIDSPQVKIDSEGPPHNIRSRSTEVQGGK